MVKNKLVEALIVDGSKLLHELDGQNFPVAAMFWIHPEDLDYWQLVITSSNVTKVGVTAAYLRLGQLLRNVELAGITLDDIYLLEPDSKQFQTLRSMVKRSSQLAAGPEWLEFEDAVVYRWTGAFVSGQLTCDISKAELQRDWDVERKLSGGPTLLVDLEGRLVTLRFHPLHGMLPGIEGVRKSFQIALHRSHRSCEIHWTN